jgi:hypothetical protein
VYDRSLSAPINRTPPEVLSLIPNYGKTATGTEVQSHINTLPEMTKTGVKGYKISSIAIVSAGFLASSKVFQSKKHVSLVEYRFDNASPR